MNKIHLYHDTKYNHNHNHNHNHNYNYDFAKVNTKLYSLSTDFFHLIKNIKLMIDDIVLIDYPIAFMEYANNEFIFPNYIGYFGNNEYYNNVHLIIESIDVIPDLFIFIFILSSEQLYHHNTVLFKTSQWMTYDKALLVNNIDTMYNGNYEQIYELYNNHDLYLIITYESFYIYNNKVIIDKDTELIINNVPKNTPAVICDHGAYFKLHDNIIIVGTIKITDELIHEHTHNVKIIGRSRNLAELRKIKTILDINYIWFTDSDKNNIPAKIMSIM